MANPYINPLPQAPNRAMARTVYPVVADAWAAAIGPWTTQVNDVVTWMGKQVDAVAASVKSASDSATAAGQAFTDAQTQAGNAKTSADAAKSARDSAQVSAQAAQAAAGLPPSNNPGWVLRQKLDGSGGVEWWLPVTSQIGDTIVSTQAPDSNWVPTGGLYLQSLYPALYAKLGRIPDMRDDQIQSYALDNLSTYSAAYGNGTFVLASYFGNQNQYQFRYSADNGATWTQSPYTAPGPIQAMAFGNGSFVGAVSNTNSVMVSTNGGQLWNQYTMPTTTSWFKMAYGNGVFVAVSFGDPIAARSTNGGQTWTSVSMPDAGGCSGLVFAFGMFVAFKSGPINNYFTSPDGITWTRRTLPASLTVQAIAFSGSILMVLPTVATSYTTKNGIDWTANQLPFTADNGYQVAGGDGIFLAFNKAENLKVWFSVDGVRWGTRSKTLASSTAFFSAIAYGGGFFVSPINGSGTVFRAKPLSYGASQFYGTDSSALPIGLNQYIKAA